MARKSSAQDPGNVRAKPLPDLLSYIEVYRASRLERIAMIKSGVRASDAMLMLAQLGICRGAEFKALNLSHASVDKKAKKGQTLSPEESERLIGIAKLIGQVEATIEEAADPEGFVAAEWMKQWISEPSPVLGGVRPADLMGTIEGQTMVSTVISQMQSGAYA